MEAQDGRNPNPVRTSFVGLPSASHLARQRSPVTRSPPVPCRRAPDTWYSLARFRSFGDQRLLWSLFGRPQLERGLQKELRTGVRSDSISGVERICVNKLHIDRAKVIANQETGTDIDVLSAGRQFRKC